MQLSDASAEIELPKIRNCSIQRQATIMRNPIFLIHLALLLPAVAVAENVIVQVATYAKDSIVKTADSCKTLWTNHQKCNDIRKQQKIFRDSCIERWESQGARESRKELQKRAGSIQGGISFADYIFLQKGKEDRGKVLNMVFLMWGAPRFLPYALWFNPDLLPSTFKNEAGETTYETTAQRFARERTVSILNTLANLERQAKSQATGGFLSGLNIFGGSAKKNKQTTLVAVYNHTKSLLINPLQNDDVIQSLRSLANKDVPFTRAEQKLVGVPACIVKGLNQAVSGKPASGILSAVTPHFLVRGSFVNHLRRLSDTDDFLVQAGVDLESIPSKLLHETCRDRMLYGSSETELRAQLHEWLTITQPEKEHYNGNLARLILMAYYGCQSIRSHTIEPTLQHLLLQNQDEASVAVSSTAKSPKGIFSK